jgi:hypothetical protein
MSVLDKKDKVYTITDSLCTARWGYPLVDFSKGEVRTCCRTKGERVTKEQIDKHGKDIFLNTDYQKERRLEMLKGVRHDDCNTCWVFEESGMQSPRFPNMVLPPGYSKPDGEIIFDNQPGSINGDMQFKSKYSGDMISPNAATLDSSIVRSEHPYMLEINLSNTCDLKCSYCSPYFSSKWEKEMDLWALGAGYQSFGPQDEEFIKKDIRKEVDERFMDLFWEWFNSGPIKTINRVGIIGGEPLINPKLPEFIDNLIKSYEKVPLNERPSADYPNPDGSPREDHKPLIWFVTNLNTPRKIMDRFINELLPKLTEVFHVEIHASLESVGKRIEYNRDGLSWEVYKENVERLCAVKLKNYHFGFQIALNALSMTTLTEFLKYAKHIHDKYERPIILKRNLVSHPEFLNPSVLTPEFAHYLEDAVDFLESVKDKMRPVDDMWGNWPQYHDYIKSIHESIRDEHGKSMQWITGDLESVRGRFFQFFNEYDKRRNLNFVKTFPEYTRFFQDCRKIHLFKKIEKTAV